jgi:hypothetical protein
VSDFEAIYYEAAGRGGYDHDFPAGIEAVVKAAQAEALEAAARRVLEPSEFLRDASTCRQIAAELREAIQ